jgi:multidrug transporter EmrE-like cation transporter
VKMHFRFLFIILSLFLQAIGGVFGKYASISLNNLDLSSLLFNKFYVLSLLCLFFQAVFWQQALRYYHLSFAYPFMSLTNFLILIFSFFLFSEPITKNNIIGLLFITTGIYFLSREG